MAPERTHSSLTCSAVFYLPSAAFGLAALAFCLHHGVYVEKRAGLGFSSLARPACRLVYQDPFRLADASYRRRSAS